MRNKLPSRTLLALSAGALCVSAAWGQTATDADGTKLEAVIVTAQRRELVITKVPMSVAAMNAAALEKQSAADLRDISRATPGLNLSNPDPSGESNISVRGISSLIGAATTGIYIDDVPVQLGNFASCPISCGGDPLPKLFDLDRVEVLRGPQGTLYGASSEGGAVRFITAAPRMRGEITGMARGQLSGTQGGAPGGEAGLVIDAPLAADLAGMRLSLWQQHEGGYVNAYSPSTGQQTASNINDSDSRVARLALRFTPTERLTVTPSYFYQEVQQSDRATYVEALGLDKTNTNIRQPLRDQFGIGALTTDYEFDAVSVKAVLSRLNRTAERTDDYSNFAEGREYLNNLSFPTGFPVGSLIEPLPTTKGAATARGLTRNSQDTWTGELRFSSNDSKTTRFSWIAGLYYQEARQGYGQTLEENVAQLTSVYDALWGAGGNLYSPHDPLGGQISYTENDHFNTTQAAVFGEANYRISSALSASMGLRYTRMGTSFDSTLDGFWAAGPNYFTGSNEETALTPKFGISYQATPDSLYYATAAKGFRPGGANPALASNFLCAADLAMLGGANAEPLLYSSDSVWSFEAGTKQTLAGGAVQLNGSLYRIDWSNVQTQVMLPTCGFGYIDNLGTATSQGLDLEIQGKASKALTLSAAVGYTEAQYTKSVVNAGYTLGVSPVQYLVKSGDALPVPRWTLTLGAEYGWNWDGVGTAYARADYQYASGYARVGSEGTQNYDPDTRDVAELQLLNLRAGVKAGAWDYSVFVKNALNTRTEMSRFHSYPFAAFDGQPSSRYYGSALAPRVFGLSVGYKF